MSLSINALIQTAERDIEVLRHNKSVQADRRQYRAAGASGKAAGSSKKTGFLAKHVRNCSKPSEVLENAVEGVSEGLKADAPTTRLLYESRGALMEAARLAKQWGY